MDLLPLADLSAADLAAWGELAAGAVEPNPFYEPELALPAWRALGAGDVALLVERGETGWDGCLPVALERRVAGVPLVLGSWRHDYSFLGTPLVAAAATERFAAALALEASSRARARFLALRGCAEGEVFGSIRTALGDGRAAVAYESGHERAALERRPQPDYLDHINARHRREMGRQRRRLGEELGGEVAVVDRTGDPGAVAEFLRLEASGWKGREGTAMATSELSGLLTEICEAFRALGRLQLLALEGGGRTAAMKCNISAGDTLFCFKIAYDESLSNYSPGVLLEADNVDVFHRERGERMMDSCAQPDNGMINRLWPDRRRIATVLAGRRGPSTRALGLARRLAARRGGGRD